MSAAVSVQPPWRRAVRTASATPWRLYLVQIAGLAGVYYAVAKVGLSAGALMGNVTPVWPPTGLAVAVLVLFGYRLWPGVFLGAVSVNGFSAVPIGTAFGMATGNTLEAVVGAYLLVSVAHFRPSLDRVRDVIAVTGLAALAGTVVSATVGVVSLRLGGVIPAHDLWATWRVWWIGDALGALVVAPAVLAWARSSKLEDSARAQFEGAALAVTVVGSTVIAFSGHFDYGYLVFPGLLWAALRYRQRGATTATLVVSTIAVVRTTAGSGPFASGSTTSSLVTLDIFLAVVALTGLIFAAVVSERDRTDRENEEFIVANERLEARVADHIAQLERLSIMLEHSRDFVTIIDESGRLQYANETVRSFFGVPTGADLRAVPKGFGFSPASQRTLAREAGPALLRDGAWIGELTLVAPDGRHVTLLQSSRLHRDADGVHAFVSGIGRDVTEQREAGARLEVALRDLDLRAQELDRSNHDLEQFAYVASHDLKEPLRAVRGFSQLLARDYNGRLDAQGDEYLDFITDGASRMQCLIDDLLTYSRVGAATAPQTIPLQTAVDDALANLRSAITADARIDIDELPNVIADPGQVTQLIQNLIGNALKFRSDAPPVVRLAAEPEGGGWIISVSDNGIGIDPRSADQIFTVFQRLHARDEYAGTGIGLAICKKLVERWGGRIWVESELGKGAVFRFTIPGPRP